jgi:monoamine oxidase
MDDSQPDESFLSFMERCFPNPSRGSRLAEAKDWATDYVSGFNAADPNLVGVHWLVAGIRAEEKNQGHRAFRSRNGYQDLLDFFEQQIAKANTSIHTETVVRRINWKPGIAEIEASTKDGSLRLKASHVLVTLPVSLLKLPGEIGAVEFVPPLPKEKIDALQKIEMGKVIRIVLRFRNRFWETISPDNNISHKKKNLTNMSFLFTEDEVFPTWWTAAPSTEPIITGWAPFRAGEILSGQPESYITQRALAALSKAVGVGVERLESWLAASYVHDWQTDPFSRGAYSYGKVGAVEAQQALSRSVEDTLFFAGEATDTSGSNGTVHGAIASGYRAAAEIIRSARR